MTARHALKHEPLHVAWREVRSLLLDVAEALWLLVCAMFWVGVGAAVFGLLAFGLKQSGQWAAGVLVIGVGFATIVYALITWLGRQTMQKPQPGHQDCPMCGAQNVRLTTRIIGHPRPGVVTLVDAGGIDVCSVCAPKAIRLACREWDASRPLIQVLPIRRVA